MVARSNEAVFLQTQINALNARIAGLSNAASARATETYERAVRERMIRDCLPMYGYACVVEAEKLVRYIVDGASADPRQD